MHSLSVRGVSPRAWGGSMNRRSVVLTVLPAVLISGFALATASSARLVTPAPAGAVTTIRAAHSGSAEVVLYDDATLSPRQTGNPDVSITGGGRLIAFSLRRAGGGQGILFSSPRGSVL